MQRLRLTALVAAAGSALAPLSAAGVARSHGAPACHASAVHYRTVTGTPGGVSGVPWVASTNSAFRGYLFYWGGTRWARARLHRARIFTTKAHLKVNPKVLWVALRPAESAVTLSGMRLDGRGSFTARYPAATGGGQFPSYVSVPTAGCWRVSVRSGTAHGSVTFSASGTPY